MTCLASGLEFPVPASLSKIFQTSHIYYLIELPLKKVVKNIISDLQLIANSLQLLPFFSFSLCHEKNIGYGRVWLYWLAYNC